MLDQYKILIPDLESELNFITIEIDDPIKLAEKAIESISSTLSKIKTLVIEASFQSQDDEIDFFKNTKPKILSKLIYYSSIYKIETKKPNGGVKIIRKYFNNKVFKLKIFFDNNLEFYRSHRTGSAFLYNKFFVRGKHDLKLNIEINYFDADHLFTTTHDNIIAKIMAIYLIQVYVIGLFSFCSIRYLIVLLILLIIIAIIYKRTDLFYANPTLAILRFRIYNISDDFVKQVTRENIIVITRDKLEIADNVKYIRLVDRIYYAKKQTNE